MNSQIEKQNTTGAWILAILAVIYVLSPIDVVPDIPVIGWVDDFFVATAASLNLIEKKIGDTNAILSKILGILKWLLIIIGIIGILIMFLIVTLILKK